MKIFDITFSSPPFIRKTRSHSKMYRDYLQVVYLLVFFSIGYYGYAALQKVVIAYVVAFICVWCYQFFDKRALLNTDAWEIPVLLYVLMLTPTTSYQEVVGGVFVMIVFGLGVFYVNKQYIFNPALLAVVSVVSFGVYNNISSVSCSMYELYQMIAYKNAQWGNTSFWIAIRDVYHVVAGAVEKTYFSLYDPGFILTIQPDYYQQFLYFYDSSKVSHSWHWYNLFFAADNFWLGTGSTLLLMIAYLWLSIRKVIDGLLPILYISVYTLLSIIYIKSALGSINFATIWVYFFDHVVWFSAVFLVTDVKSLPMNKKGRIYFAIYAAALAAIFNVNAYTHINHIMAIILANITSAFLEIFGRQSIFGFPKYSQFAVHNTQNHFLSDTRDECIWKGGLGAVMILIVYFCYCLMPQDIFRSQRSSFYPELIRDLFPDYVIQKKIEPGIYKVSLLRDYVGIVIFDSVKGYRDNIMYAAVIKDNILLDIKIVDASGEHPLIVQKHWETLFTGIDIDQFPKTLDNLAQLNIDVISGATVSSKSFLEVLSHIKQKYSKHVDKIVSHYDAV